MAADPTKSLSFVLNGTPATVADPDPRQTLLDYLRSPEIGLTGAKASCGEGGCGACTVLLARYEHGRPRTQGWGNIVAGDDAGVVIERTVNACLTPLCSLDGAAVTTIEGLSDERGTPHPIALRLAEMNGSQCGYCSPGWVMSMHALLRREPRPTGSAIEDAFDGHICRCTGYRAILDAMQSFAADCGATDPQSLCAHRPLALTPCGPESKPPGPARYGHGPDRWRRAVSLVELSEAWSEARCDGLEENLRLVAGNTAAALDKEPDGKPRFIVDISAIPELNAVEDGSANGARGLILGGAVSFARAIAEFGARATDDAYAASGQRFQALSAYLRGAANAQVRNRATLGGHLGMYLAHRRSKKESPFLSDLLPFLVALEAKVRYATTPDGAPCWAALEDFLKIEAPLPVVHAVLVPFAPGEEIVGADRVARRPQNAKPLVSAAWRLDLDDGHTTIDGARIAYCGLGVGPLRARGWERALRGRSLDQLRTATAERGLPDDIAECATTNFPPERIVPMTGEELPAVDRRRLARDLFQRFVIQGFRPGARFERPVSGGHQRNSEDDDAGPLGEEIPKLEGRIQTAGQALYTADLPGPPGTLAACYVIGARSAATFRFKYTRQELTRRLLAKDPDFVDYIAADVLNSSSNRYRDDEELLAAEEVTCFGQPIALVLARSLRAAKEAAKAIGDQIEYTDRAPAWDLDAARKRKMLLGKTRLLERPEDDLTPTVAVERARGTMRTGAQAHFYMEPQAILAVPDDDGGITLTASSQHLEACQEAAADALGLPARKVRVKTTRLGGGFGGKETRTPPIAAVAALAAMRVRRPVRLVLERDADTTIVGYRHPFEGQYEVAFDGDGRIHELNLVFTLDGGNSKDVTQHILDLAVLSADGAYFIPRFRVDGASYRTSRMTRTAMRTFGVTQCSLIRETAIEHVAHALGMLPEDVRRLNFYPDSEPDLPPSSTHYGQKLNHCIINDVWRRLLADGEFYARAEAVAEFNRQSPWRKRGISMLPIKYGVAYTFLPYNQGSAYVAVYAQDGSVLVHTGAVEMGQGVNTKLAQLTADVLGVPLELVEVAPSSTEVIPNASSSGASTGADLHGGALMKACRVLRGRLTRLCRELQKEDAAPEGWDRRDGWQAAWPKIIRLAYERRLNLSAQAHYQSPRVTGFGFDDEPGEPFLYFTYSAACSEVEIDVLTGELNVRRADILYDAGRSLNPMIDTGQIQGGFVQGLGNVTTEEIYYDDSGGSGAPLSSNFWNYKPPCSKTIPAQFNTRIYQYDNAELNALPGAPFAVWRSKSTGEPPAVLANSVFFAIRHAVAAARQAQGWPGWFEFDAPATVARIQRACRERETVARTLAPVANAR